MTVSLTVIVSGLISFVTILVGASCLAVTLIFTYDSINDVGNAWAKQLSEGVASSFRNFLNGKIEAGLAGTAMAAKEYAQKLPSQDSANWTKFWVPQLLRSFTKYEDFDSYTIAFEDLSWMYVSYSGDTGNNQTAAVRVEWFEPTVPFDGDSEFKVGGVRFWMEAQRKKACMILNTKSGGGRGREGETEA